MRMLRTIRLRVRSLFRGRRVDEDLDAELRGHLDRQIELHCAAGLSPADARAAALREFGNIAVVQEQCRDTRRVNWIEDLRRDLAYALRSMRKAPGFTAVAMLSLGAGDRRQHRDLQPGQRADVARPPGRPPSRAGGDRPTHAVRSRQFLVSDLRAHQGSADRLQRRAHDVNGNGSSHRRQCRAPAEWTLRLGKLFRGTWSLAHCRAAALCGR